MRAYAYRRIYYEFRKYCFSNTEGFVLEYQIMNTVISSRKCFLYSVTVTCR